MLISSVVTMTLISLSLLISKYNTMCRTEMNPDDDDVRISSKILNTANFDLFS